MKRKLRVWAIRWRDHWQQKTEHFDIEVEDPNIAARKIAELMLEDDTDDGVTSNAFGLEVSDDGGKTWAEWIGDDGEDIMPGAENWFDILFDEAG